MGFRGARAPVSLVSLLLLGVWAGSAFAGGAIGAASTVLTDTVSTGGDPTSPTSTVPPVTGTDPAGGGDTTTSVTVTTPTFTVTGPTFTFTVPNLTVALPPLPTRRHPQPPPTTPTVTVTTPTVTVPPPGGGVKVPPPTSPSITVTTPVTVPGSTPRDLVVPVVAGSVAAAPTVTTDATPATADIAPTATAGTIVRAGATKIAKSSKQHAARVRHHHPRALRAKTRPGTSTPSSIAGQPRSNTTPALSVQSSTTTATKVKPPVVSTAAPRSQSPGSLQASGGRAQGLPRGTGEPAFDGPRGVSPKEFQFGASGSSIASVHRVVSAALVTLEALVAFAALIGGIALVRKMRSDRRAARRRALHTRANGSRTRQELYSEARRQNIKGRSSMNKAQLERALGPH